MGPSLATTFPGEMPPAAPIAPLAYAGDPGIGDQGPESVRIAPCPVPPRCLQEPLRGGGGARPVWSARSAGSPDAGDQCRGLSAVSLRGRAGLAWRAHDEADEAQPPPTRRSR